MGKITEFSDVSEHNHRPVDDSYRDPWLAYRACDGTYPDPLFPGNDKWARAAKILVGFIVYSVWPRSVGFSTWQETLATLTGLLGTSHRPRMVLMDDIESWDRGDLRKNFSAGIEAKRRAEVAYLHSLRPKWQTRYPFGILYRSRDNRRVIGYGNRSDLLTMARDVKWKRIILADYSSAPTPKRFGSWRVVGRQYTDAGPVRPWGTSDRNRALMSAKRLARVLGLGRFRWTL